VGRFITCIAGWMIVVVMNRRTRVIKLIHLSAGQSLYGPGAAYCHHAHQIFVPGGGAHCWRVITTVS
jgi:hypothetical protein